MEEYYKSGSVSYPTWRKSDLTFLLLLWMSPMIEKKTNIYFNATAVNQRIPSLVTLIINFLKGLWIIFWFLCLLAKSNYHGILAQQLNFNKACCCFFGVSAFKRNMCLSEYLRHYKTIRPRAASCNLQACNLQRVESLKISYSNRSCTQSKSNVPSLMLCRRNDACCLGPFRPFTQRCPPNF